MPIYNSKDLLPFVNGLESKINEMTNAVSEWDKNRGKINTAVSRVDGIYSTAMQSLIKADEAVSEIGTATFKSTAKRGKRLEDTFNKLRNDMYEIAATVEGKGGGGALTEGMFFDELNNAISAVDATIEDGLKLDYRLREINNLAKEGAALPQKLLHMPYKYDASAIATISFVLPEEEGITYIEAEVTVLNSDSEPILNDSKIITATIDSLGYVQLSAIPNVAYFLYFPVEMKLKDIPEDFLYLFMQQVVQKNSRLMEIVLNFENQIEMVLTDIEFMKGVNWTPDFSIMKNHQGLVKEGITPKGLDVEIVDGMAHVDFSYNEHPNLSHFVLEKWDEGKKEFQPYDGIKGIISK